MFEQHFVELRNRKGLYNKVEKELLGEIFKKTCLKYEKY